MNRPGHEDNSVMSQIETYVFFDLQTTDLREVDKQEPGITELGMLVIKRRHFLQHGPNEDLRVKYKLHMCFNPQKKISEEVELCSGLTNDLLFDETELNIEAFNAVNSFLSCLQEPICLIAHDGFNAHFPILKYYLKKMDVKLPEELKCTDSHYAFRDLLETGKTGDVGLREKSFTKVKRGSFNSPNECSKYKLEEIYRAKVPGSHLEGNRSEDRCMMMLRIAQLRADRFEEWVHQNHRLFYKGSRVTKMLSFLKKCSPV